MKLLNEDAVKKELDDNKAKRVATYRKYAQLKDDEQINLEDLQDWAVRRTCREFTCSRESLLDSLKESLLVEETIGDLADKADADLIKKPETKNQIEAVLDKCYHKAKVNQKLGKKNDFPNVLFISAPGFGKSSMVKQWAEAHDINLITMIGATMEASDVGGAVARDEEKSKKATRLSPSEFDVLDQPNSVLFLDELNRAPRDVRATLLNMIADHVVRDAEAKGGQRFMPNWLFTIAAINPSRDIHNDSDDLNSAEKTRFASYDLNPDPLEQLAHLEREYKHAISVLDPVEDAEDIKEFKGRLNIANAILTHKDFDYDSEEDIDNSYINGNGIALNYRSFKNALDQSDGTKDDFLRGWNNSANSLKLNRITDILKNYKDKDDKANDALRNHESESDVFAKKVSKMDKIHELKAKQDQERARLASQN